MSDSHNSALLRLWGIDGPLGGTADAVVRAHPIIYSISQPGVLLLARTPYWTVSDGLQPITLQTAQSIGTDLSHLQLRIPERSIVVAVSQSHLGSLRNLGLTPFMAHLRWIDVDGPVITFMRVDDFHAMSTGVARAALSLFERTLSAAHHSPDLARLKLAESAIVAWPGLPTELAMFCRLIVHLISGSGTEYDVLLHYTSGLLDRDVAELDRSVQRRLMVSRGAKYQPLAGASVKKPRENEMQGGSLELRVDHTWPDPRRNSVEKDPQLVAEALTNAHLWRESLGVDLETAR